MFFQVKVDSSAVRNDQEHWIFKSNVAYWDFQRKYTSGCPTQADLDLVDFHLYGDVQLTDAVGMGQFHGCMLISPALKALILERQFDQNQLFIFDKPVRWRGNLHLYHWLHTHGNPDDYSSIDWVQSRFMPGGSEQLVRASDINDWSAKTNGGSFSPEQSEIYIKEPLASQDLFKSHLLQSLFCSEKFKQAVQTAGLTGLLFQEASYLKKSKVQVQKKAPPSVKFMEPVSAVPRWVEPPVTPLADRAEWRRQLLEKASLYMDKTDISAITARIDQWCTPVFIGNLPPEGTSEPATHHFGGKPLLPASFAWPRTTHGRALAFVAQIDLGALPPNDELPHEGLLAFFADAYGCTDGWPIEQDRFRVHYFEDKTTLIRTDAPADFLLGPDFEVRPIEFVPRFDLTDDRWPELFTDEAFPEKAVYQAFLANIYPLHGQEGELVKLLGTANAVQGPVALEAVLYADYGGDWSKYEAHQTEMLQKAQTWRLLFQFNAGQAGLADQWTDPAVYFLIESDALKAKDFSKVAVVFQST